MASDTMRGSTLRHAIAPTDERQLVEEIDDIVRRTELVHTVDDDTLIGATRIRVRTFAGEELIRRVANVYGLDYKHVESDLAQELGEHWVIGRKIRR